MAGKIRIERDGATTARVWLDSPGRLNAISEAMWLALTRGFESLAAEPELRCVVLRGAGGNFAAGADIEEFERIRFDAVNGRRYHLETVANAIAAIEHCPIPVVAAIEGVCVGGGLEVAIACDLRLAADNARIGAPVGRVGFPFALPELAPMLRLVGPGVASELLLEGRLLTAPQAEARGLVTRAIPVAEFEHELNAAVGRIAAGSPRAARENKNGIRLLTANGCICSAQELDASFGFLESEDYHEGVRAFLAKRPPQFTGR